jgi:hypothetical protein
MVNWLANDDSQINIPAKITPDKSLQLSTTSQAIIGFGFLVVIPLIFLVSGVYVWYRRRKN